MSVPDTTVQPNHDPWYSLIMIKPIVTDTHVDHINCDFCHTSCDYAYVDGRTLRGPWANMCLNCHVIYGVGLGTGKGQKFVCREKTWIKIEV